MQPFAGFDQRPDNKLWLFYEKSGEFRLRKVFVFAYTWFDARDGALVGLNPSTRDMEGEEIESPEDVMLDEGSTIVFAGTKQGQFEIIELLRRMSGKEASKLIVFKSKIGKCIECGESNPERRNGRCKNVPASEHQWVYIDDEVNNEPKTEGLELLTSIRKKLEHAKVVKSNGYGLATPYGHDLTTLSEVQEDDSSSAETIMPTNNVPLCVDCAQTWLTICQSLKPGEEVCAICAFADDPEVLNTIFSESVSDETSLRQLQVSLPWTIRYSRDFRANPQSHKNFAHALVHVHKAAGKLAALVDDMDHDREVADDPTLRERHAKYIADLVVCALRLANEFPGGHVDLQKAVIERIQTKNSETPAKPG